MRTDGSSITYGLLTQYDVPAALALWTRSPGVGLSSADEPEALARFLQRNDGFCFGAFAGARLVGTILCGTDGRRGYIYHLAVDEAFRRNGAGRHLVELVLEAAGHAGIGRCHAMVYASNEQGRRFWELCGWRLRDDLVIYSRDVEP